MSDPEPKAYTLVKRAGVLCLIGMCVWCSAELALLLRLYRQQSVSVLRNVDSVTQELQSSARAFKAVSELQAAQISDPKTQRSLGVLLRTGDDVGRLVDKLNGTVSRVNTALDTVNRETLPKVNQCLDGSSALILKCSDGVQLVLADTDAVILQIRNLLKQPEIQDALVSLSKTAANTDRITNEIAATSAEVRTALPALLVEIQSLAKNSAASSEEVAAMLKRFNAPVSKKDRVIQFLLRLLIAGGPTLVQLGR